jgi:hypothetical protein
MALCLSSLLSLFTSTFYLPAALGMEHAGDAAYSHELEQHANVAARLEEELLALIEAAPNEERFFLYWTYNHLTGSWIQVEYLHAQLESAVQAYSDEEPGRTALRDQAEFVHWELGRAIDALQQDMPEVRRLNHLWMNEALRSLLSEVRVTAYRLWAEQCARMPCVSGP